MKKKKTAFYKKFLGSLTKQGKKVAAKRILEHSLIKVSKKTKLPIYFILRRISSKLNS
jgi:ribosomal protein S7